MGRRKKTDERTAKQIRGPGRKAKKQGEPVFPKELTQNGENFVHFNRSNNRDFIFFL